MRGQRAGDERAQRRLPSLHRPEGALMHTPVSIPPAAARRRHRRHLRPRPGAGRGASPRAATRSPSSPATATRSRRSRAGSRAATASSATSPRKDDAHAIALQVGAALGGLDVLVNNASSLGPVPLALLADTECEDLEAALATNLVGPFRLTKALLGLLAACGARRAAAGAARRAQRLQRRRGHALCRLGRVRREQGGAGAPEPDLGRGAPAARRRRRRRRSRRHGHAAPCPGRARRRSGDA